MDISQNSLDRFLNQEIEYKNRKEELVDKIVTGINQLRVGTEYKPVSHRLIALKINSHPILKKDLGELELLYRECMSRGSFSKFWWICK